MKEFKSRKNYLDKHRFKKRLIDVVPSVDTNIIVVIPCYNEPDILKTLQSLSNSDKTFCRVEVLVIINSGDAETDEVIAFNQKTENDINTWIHASELTINFFVRNIEQLPNKHAGVGLARKIGMDEAADRFDQISNRNGIIVCLDADCVVDKNYLTEIESHFIQHQNSTGCSIYFEHQLNGDFDSKVIEAIISYELFLRYYNLSLKFSGFPYSFHTIGSCMAVRNYVYQKQGGMNRRKAGEDFYFLHKIFPLGDFTELNTTTVYPSPRISNRVPFGTGSAVNKFVVADANEFFTYDFRIFNDLKTFFGSIEYLFQEAFLPESFYKKISPTLKSFLLENSFEEKIQEIKLHVASNDAFVKRFYDWFDGFMVLKFVHYATEKFHPKKDIVFVVNQLLEASKLKPVLDMSDKKQLLQHLRSIERNNGL